MPRCRRVDVNINVDASRSHSHSYPRSPHLRVASAQALAVRAPLTAPALEAAPRWPLPDLPPRCPPRRGSFAAGPSAEARPPHARPLLTSRFNSLHRAATFAVALWAGPHRAFFRPPTTAHAVSAVRRWCATPPQACLAPRRMRAWLPASAPCLRSVPTNRWTPLLVAPFSLDHPPALRARALPRDLKLAVPRICDAMPPPGRPPPAPTVPLRSNPTPTRRIPPCALNSNAGTRSGRSPRVAHQPHHARSAGRHRPRSAAPGPPHPSGSALPRAVRRATPHGLIML